MCEEREREHAREKVKKSERERARGKKPLFERFARLLPCIAASQSFRGGG